MANIVCSTAQLKCSQSKSPSVLTVIPVNRCVSKLPLANILDNKPLVNIMPFGMCDMTMLPCVPATAAPWIPGSTRVFIGNMPALDNNCKLICSVGGVIEITYAGQAEITVG